MSDEFRKGGWAATYPTRSRDEWKQILSQWEEHILRGGPQPEIIAPARYAGSEGMAPPKNGKKTAP